jgi:hypothetical protein
MHPIVTDQEQFDLLVNLCAYSTKKKIVAMRYAWTHFALVLKQEHKHRYVLRRNLIYH